MVTFDARQVHIYIILSVICKGDFHSTCNHPWGPPCAKPNQLNWAFADREEFFEENGCELFFSSTTSQVLFNIREFFGV